jgi:hypothetical protein
MGGGEGDLAPRGPLAVAHGVARLHPEHHLPQHPPSRQVPATVRAAGHGAGADAGGALKRRFAWCGARMRAALSKPTVAAGRSRHSPARSTPSSRRPPRRCHCSDRQLLDQRQTFAHRTARLEDHRRRSASMTPAAAGDQTSKNFMIGDRQEWLGSKAYECGSAPPRLACCVRSLRIVRWAPAVPAEPSLASQNVPV